MKKLKINEIVEDNGMVRSGKYLNYTIKNLMELKQEEIKGITYIRHWDLSNYDKNMLEEYKLFDIEYIYVGVTGESNFKNRTCKWKHNIKNYPYMVDKEVVLFYNRYKKMMIEEYEMSEDDFDEFFFYNSEVELYLFRNKEMALDNETLFLNTYFQLWIFEKSTSFPMNSKDSDFKLDKNRKVIKFGKNSYLLEVLLLEWLEKMITLKFSENNGIMIEIAQKPKKSNNGNY